MPVDRKRAWQIGARGASVLLIAILAYFTWLLARWIIDEILAPPNPFGLIGFVLALFLFATAGAILIAGYWSAYRLWTRWNASTVRFTVAFSLALLAFCLSVRTVIAVVALLEYCLDAQVPEKCRATIEGVSSVLYLILGAVAYRKLSHWIIAVARLDDPVNEYGEALGHQYRVNTFCRVLGFVVWLASSTVLEKFFPFVPGKTNIELQGALTSLVSIVAGYSVYKILRWKMSPDVRPALPAGGFAILPLAVQSNQTL
jgi:hypothetical protein